MTWLTLEGKPTRELLETFIHDGQKAIIDTFKRLPGFPQNIVSGKELDLKVEDFIDKLLNPIKVIRWRINK